MATQLDFGIVMLSLRQQAVYDILFSAAEAGDNCPTNGDIAKAIGNCWDRHIVDDVKALECFGYIRRVNVGGGLRTVEIVQTGKRCSTARNAAPVIETVTVIDADALHLAKLAKTWVRFEDHPNAKPCTSNRVYPHRTEAIGRIASCGWASVA